MDHEYWENDSRSPERDDQRGNRILERATLMLSQWALMSGATQ